MTHLITVRNFTVYHPVCLAPRLAMQCAVYLEIKLVFASVSSG